MGILDVIGMFLLVIALGTGLVIAMHIKELLEKMKFLVLGGVAIGVFALGGMGMIFSSESENANNKNDSVALEQEKSEINSESDNSNENDKIEKNKEEINEEQNEQITPSQNESISENMNLATEILDIQSASSSSVLSDGHGISYDANLTFDGDKKSAWVEGALDNGVNEWVELNLYTDSLITEVGIVSGYTKNSDIYNKNNRPKKLKLSFEDGTQKIVELKDGDMNVQNFKLDRPVRSSYVTITILEVYKGNKYDDTCISEVIITGAGVTQSE